MMEKLVTVKDVSERYGCSMPTARKYLRQMFHYEAPLAAPMWAFNEWEKNRERMPANISKKREAEINYKRQFTRVIVPRHR